MVYISEPPRDKYIDIALGVVTYFFGVAYGLWTFFLPPNTIENQVGLSAIRYTALISVVGSALCMVGVIGRKAVLESIAIWIALSGLVFYTAVVWSMVSDSPTRGSQAFALSLASCALAWRGFRLSRKPYNLEKLKELEDDANSRLEGEL